MQWSKSFTLISCTATTNLITLPERTFLWSRALLRPPLPSPQSGDWPRQDPGISGEDRRWCLAQLPHGEDGTVWEGHSGRTRQRFYRSRLVIKQKHSANFLKITELHIEPHLTVNTKASRRSWSWGPRSTWEVSRPGPRPTRPRCGRPPPGPGWSAASGTSWWTGGVSSWPRWPGART